MNEQKLKNIIGKAMATNYALDGVFKLEDGMIKPIRKPKDIIIQLK